LGPKERKQQEDGENYMMGGFIICTLHQILLGTCREDEMGGACSTDGENIM
jgi:hypothetical protein